MTRAAVAIALLAALALPTAALARDVQVARFDGGPPSQARPSTLGVGAKGVVEGISWKSWNGPTATGRGTYDIAGFAGEPGSGYNAPTGLTFSGKRSCGSKLVYSKLTLHLTKPIGGKLTLRFDYTRCTTPSATRRCGDLSDQQLSGLHVSNVRATRTTCATARKVAGTWRGKPGCGRLPAGGPTTCAPILGYACTRIAGSGETLVYRCANGTKSVRFDAGS